MGAWAAGVLVELALALEGVEELEEERDVLFEEGLKLGSERGGRGSSFRSRLREASPRSRGGAQNGEPSNQCEKGREAPDLSIAFRS